MNYLKTEIWMDIKQGIIKSYKKFIPVVIMGAALAILVIVTVHRLYSKGRLQYEEFSLADMMLYFFKGKSVCTKEMLESNRLNLPYNYMLVNFYLMFLVGDYLLRDMCGYGKTVLVRTQKRISWWLSKCIWCVAQVLVFYGLFYLCMVIATVCAGGTLSLKPIMGTSLIINGLDFSQSEFTVNIGAFMVTAVLLPILVSIAMMLMQMTIGMFMQPIVGYVVNAVIIVASYFIASPLLLGNAFMMVRSELYKDGVINPVAIVGVSIFIIIVSVVAGGAYFNRMDIIQRDKLML